MGTPNPRSVKFLTDRTLVAVGSADFRTPESCVRSPLAARLFDLDHVSGVFICQNFVTVTADNDEHWAELSPTVVDALGAHLAADEPILVDSDEATDEGAESGAGPDAGTSEVETKIREILDQQIRPAVAMDGGDIKFVEFVDGVVRLKMQGACGGCPSSTATLKQGIEARLRHFIPQVQSVEAV
ncbi:NifU family protein [bacterium]|nr:MAG: NifU family protein [bacterium]RKZ14778.1 MAG: NifU family protein [bacterium]